MGGELEAQHAPMTARTAARDVALSADVTQIWEPSQRQEELGLYGAWEDWDYGRQQEFEPLIHEGHTLPVRMEDVPPFVTNMVWGFGMAGTYAWATSLAESLPQTRDVELAWKGYSREHQGEIAAGVADPQALKQQLNDADQHRLLIAQAVFAELRRLEDLEPKFIEWFEQQAEQMLEALLRASEERLNSEKIRYGLGALELQIDQLASGIYGGQTFGGGYIGGLANIPPALKLLRAHAGYLLQKREVLDAKLSEIATEQDVLQGIMMQAYAYETGGEPPEVVEAYNQALYRSQELDAQRDELQLEYDVLFEAVAEQHPILAAFKDKSHLKMLAEGFDSEAVGALAYDIARRLGNITKVRDGIANDKLSVLEIPEIVARTKHAIEATPLEQKWIDGYIAAGKLASSILEIALDVVQFAVAFIPLVGPFLSAGIGLARLPGKIQEYELKKAMAGTDFDKARAISQEEPSLFWLAVDIVLSVVDVVAALKAFKAVGKATKAAVAIDAAADPPAARRALEVLEETAMREGGEELAKRVVARARALQKGGGSLESMLAHESEAIRTAARAVDDELAMLGRKALLGETAGKFGGKVKVTRNGHIVSCASPCMWMRERYAAQLAKDPETLRELEALERRGAEIAGKVDEAAMREGAAIAEGAAAIEAKLRKIPPGEWESPLAKAANYEETLARRGSAAEQLDRKPPGWTGSMEAEFLGLPPADDGYRWVLDAEGKLSYQRMKEALPRKWYNPTSGEFEDVSETVVRARYVEGAEQVHGVDKMAHEIQEDLDELFRQRADLIGKRNELEALEEAGTLTKAQREELARTRSAINERTRVMADKAGEDFMRSIGAEPVKPFTPGRPSSSGDFDQVWSKLDADGSTTYYIVETKGGGAGLGTRKIGHGRAAEQGTRDYFESLIASLAKKRETAGIAQTLRKALRDGKLKYIRAKLPLGATGANDLKISEFLL